MPLLRGTRLALRRRPAAAGGLAPVFRLSAASTVYSDAGGTTAATAQGSRVRSMRDSVSGTVLVAGNAGHAGGTLEVDAYAGGGNRAVRMDRSLGGLVSGFANASLDLGLSANDYTVAARVVALDAQGGVLFSPVDDGNTGLLALQYAFQRPFWLSFHLDGGVQAAVPTAPADLRIDTGTASVAETIIQRVSPTGVSFTRNGVTSSTSGFTPPTGTLAPGVVVGAGYSADNRLAGRYDLLELRVYSPGLSDDEAATVAAELDALPAPGLRFATTRTLAVCDGNSLLNSGVANVNTAWPGLLQVSLAGCHVTNQGIGGASFSGAASGAALTATLSGRLGGLLAGAYPLKIYVIQELTNEIFLTADTAATIYARWKAHCQAVKAIDPDIVILAVTAIPNVNITNAGRDAVRTDTNALVKADFSGTPAATRTYPAAGGNDWCDLLVDPTERAEFDAAGDVADTDVYADGAHPATAGHVLLEADIRGACIYLGASTDGTPPDLTSAQYQPGTTTLLLTFSESVVPVANPTLSLSGGAATAAYASGTGTATLTYTVSRSVASGETGTMSGAAGFVRDAAGNDTPAASGFAVTEQEFPATLTPAGWWDAGYAFQDVDCTVAAGNGDAVAGLFDRSGNGRHWTQATGASRPTLTLSGDYRLVFDGSNDLMAVPLAALAAIAGGGEIHCVWKRNDSVFAGHWDLGSGTDYYPFSGHIYESFGTDTRYDFDPVSSLSARHVYSVRAAANDWRVWVDRVSRSTRGTNTVAFNTLAPKIGVNELGNYAAMDLCEVVLTPLLTDDQRADLWDYFTAKRGTP